MSDTIVTITADDIAQKQADERRLERQIADAMQELAETREWLRAAAILRKGLGTRTLFGFPDAHEEYPEPPSPMPGEPQPKLATPEPPADPNNLTDAIETIANDSPVAVTKKELKRTLKKRGFPAERLENYFYTAIHRLKNKGRITVMSDGSVWKAPPGASRQN